MATNVTESIPQKEPQLPSGIHAWPRDPAPSAAGTDRHLERTACGPVEGRKLARDAYPKSDYKEYPKTLPRDDFWGQVRRTVNGKPVSEHQILMIVDAIRNGLALESGDAVLDLACGNGALASYLRDACAMTHGVDFSEHLISVAREHFERPGQSSYQLDDVANYVHSEKNPDRFTKVLCYGSFTYFTAAEAIDVLATLRRRFRNVSRIFIGNLPDRERAHMFYPKGLDYAADLTNHLGQIGIWRSQQELEHLAAETGWTLQLQQMPQDFYAARFRFDAILNKSD